MEHKPSVRDIEEGSEYGRWRVVGIAENIGAPSRGTGKRFRCECSVDLGGCGKVKDVIGAHLVRGASRSCGCLNKEILAARVRVPKPRKVIPPEIRTWRDIINRCYNKTNSAWKWYGGKGTYCCDGWRLNQHQFVADMGPKPSPTPSIDRKDNTGSYTCGKCPQCIERGVSFNCRWVTNDVQARNQSRTRYLTHDGKTMTVADWTTYLGWKGSVIYGRLDKGWTVEQALTTPMLNGSGRLDYAVANGIAPVATPDAARSEPTKQRNPNPRKPWKHIPAAE